MHVKYHLANKEAILQEEGATQMKARVSRAFVLYVDADEATILLEALMVARDVKGKAGLDAQKLYESLYTAVYGEVVR